MISSKFSPNIGRRPISRCPEERGSDISNVQLRQLISLPLKLYVHSTTSQKQHIAWHVCALTVGFNCLYLGNPSLIHLK